MSISTSNVSVVAPARQGPQGPTGLFPYGEWSGETEYPKDAVLARNNSLWLSLKSNTGVEPGTDDTAWKLWISGGAAGVIYSDAQNLNGTQQAQARANITAQASSATLSAIAALGMVAGSMIFATGANAVDIVPSTAYGRSLLNAADRNALVSGFALAPADVALGNVANAAQTLASVVPNTAPGAGHILVGTLAGSAYAPVAVSGDASLSPSGALSVAKIAGVAPGPFYAGADAANLTGFIDNARLSGVPNSALANSSVTISSHPLALGGALNLAYADIAGLGSAAQANLTATNTQVAFNDAGALAGSGQFTFDKTTGQLVLTPGATPSNLGSLIINANTVATSALPGLSHKNSLHIIAADADFAAIFLSSYGTFTDGVNFASARSVIDLRGARGTCAAPVALVAGDEMARVSGRGHIGTAFTNSVASVSVIAAENFTSTGQGAFLGFRVTALGTVGGGSRTVPPLAAAVTPSGGVIAGKDLFTSTLYSCLINRDPGNGIVLAESGFQIKGATDADYLTLLTAAGTGQPVIKLPFGSTDFTITGGAHNVLMQGAAGGAFTVAQLAAGDVSGLAASATTDATNAANITSGVLPNARLSGVPNSALANPNVTIGATAVALGGTVTALQGVAKLYPAADSTAALQITKADGATAVGTWDTTNGGLALGTASALSATTLLSVYKSGAGAQATVIADGAGSASIIVAGYRNSAAAAGHIQVNKSRGTMAASTPVNSLDAIGDIIFGAVLSSGAAPTATSMASVAAFVDTYVGTTDASSYVVCSTRPNGAGASLVEVWRASKTGGFNIGVYSTDPGAGNLAVQNAIVSGAWNGSKIGLAYGGSNADLSATGGAHRVLMQASAGAAVTVAQLTAADIGGLGPMAAYQNAAGTCELAYLSGVDISTTGAETLFNLALPAGCPRYRLTSILVMARGGSAWNSATIEVRSGSGGTGISPFNAMALTSLTTNALDTAGALQAMNVVTTTMVHDFASLYLHVNTGAGTASTVDILIFGSPIPA